MTNATSLNALTESMVSKFLAANALQSISVAPNVNFNGGRQISDVILLGTQEVEGVEEDYRVSFKLQDEGADLCQYLKDITAQPALSVELTDEGSELDEDQVDKMVQKFLKLIKSRVEKAKQEQDVQSIRFVGNTFVLNKSTTFKVLSDDGDGRLNIEIIGGDGLQDVMMSAHGLLDGLYTGFIELVEK